MTDTLPRFLEMLEIADGIAVTEKGKEVFVCSE